MNHKTLRIHIRKRLQNVGVPSDVSKKISDRYAFQLSNQGEQGAADYIKCCGDAILRYLYETPVKSPGDRWVATRHRFPKFFLGCESLPESVLKRVAKVARAISLATCNQTQVDKVTQAVIKPYSGDYSAVTQISQLIKQGVAAFAPDGVLLAKDPYDYWPDGPNGTIIGRQFKRIQSVSHKTGSVEEPLFKEALQLIADHPDLRVPGWESIFFPLTPAATRLAVQRLERAFEARVPYVGEIHAAQEGGCKLRMFAAPFTVVQCILYPLHYSLADVLRTVTTNCTFDQASGAKVAQEWLRAGRRVHSVDLRTATCRFPLIPQTEMLGYLGVPEHWISLLEYVCRGLWYCGVDTAAAFAMPSLQWAVGQPLGIAPSMSMFSLAHNFLLWGLCVRLNKNPEETFRILGDDVVIADDELASEYIRVLGTADIPVSTNKCHSSDRFAEFAGYSISVNDMTRPGQWRRPDARNLLSVAEDLGTPLYGEVSKLLERVQEVFLFSRGKYSPPPSEWPTFVKISTMLNLLRLERWTLIRAPLWYYKTMEVISKQLGYEPDYEWMQPSLELSMRQFLVDLARELDKRGSPNLQPGEVVPNGHQEYIELRFWCMNAANEEMDLLSSSAQTMFDCYQLLNDLWSFGTMSEQEYHLNTQQMYEGARSLLFVPPPRSKENDLIHMGKTLTRLLKSATHSISKNDCLERQGIHPLRPEMEFDLNF